MARDLPRYLAAAVLLIATLTACAGSAAAQEIPTETKPGGFVTVGGTVSDYQINYGDHKLGGATVFADINLTTHYGIEGEERWLIFHQQQDLHATTSLVGPRVVFDARVLGRLRPYAKFLVGDANFTFPYDYATGQYFVMAPGAGVDLPIGHKLSLRLIDVEYQSWPQFSYGSLHPYGASVGMSYQIF